MARGSPRHSTRSKFFDRRRHFVFFIRSSVKSRLAKQVADSLGHELFLLKNPRDRLLDFGPIAERRAITLNRNKNSHEATKTWGGTSVGCGREDHSTLFSSAYLLCVITWVKPAMATVGVSNLPSVRLAKGGDGVNLKGIDPPGAISPASVG